MAYGLQVRTPSGLVDISEMTSACRYIGLKTGSGSSGSVTVPTGWNSSVGIFVPVNTDSTFYLSQTTWTLSGNTLSWSGAQSNMSWNIYFFHRNETAGGTGYGFWAKNGNGIVILNDTDRPLGISSTGSSSGVAKPENLWRHEIPCAITDMVLFRFNVGDIGAVAGYKDGKRHIYHNAQTITYAISKPNVVPPAGSGYGLEIYNSSGARVFSDNMDILNVVDGGYYSQASWSRTIDSGTLYAYLAGQIGVDGGNPNSSILVAAFQRLTATTMNVVKPKWEEIELPVQDEPINMPLAGILAK